MGREKHWGKSPLKGHLSHAEGLSFDTNGFELPTSHVCK